ncbi:WSC domain-containing protein [Phlyctema vagabunda]|uniref:WSC domain-containing protein n=1 Tax=Phlyctema vagabunda TaxID=108571 RepID=A0ABR4P6X3_9HELO
MAPLLPSRIAVLICSLLVLIALASAQSTTASTTPTPTPTPTIVAASGNWKYLGCFNETLDVNNTAHTRALDGTTESLDSMTVQVCLDFCGSVKYAGLEYTKECYCSPYISSLSARLDDAQCNLPCVANSSQICGGPLAVSVYQQGDDSKNAASRYSGLSGLALGVAIGGLLILA